MLDQPFTQAQMAKERGVRIIRILDRLPISRRQLQVEVEKQTGGASGSSWGSINALIRGKTARPNMRIVEAIADTLGIHREYLTELKGTATLMGDFATEAGGTQDRVDDADYSSLALRALLDVVERLPWERHDLPHECEQIFLSVAYQILYAGGRSLGDYTAEEIGEVIEPLGWAWMLPSMAFHQESTWDDRDFWQYFMSMGAAIRAAMPHPTKADPALYRTMLRRMRASVVTERDRPKHYHKAGGMWWAGPFCPNDEHGLDSVEMEFKGEDRYVCPSCDLEVVSPVAPGGEELTR